MITLTAKIRKDAGGAARDLRKKGVLPAVLYGSKIEPYHLEIDQKEFDRVYREAGESSLVSLLVDKKNFSVLIHDVQSDPLILKPIHVDFFQPSLTEEIEVKIPVVLVGEAPAVKELGGTLIKNISEIEVKALPQNLPHEIRIDVTPLKYFENNILIKDLIIQDGVKILREPDEVVAFVASPEKIEEELEKPIEEKIEEVEKVEKAKKEEEPEEEKGEVK